MNKLIPIYFLLTIIFYSCTNIHFCYKTNDYDLNIEPSKPGDTISQSWLLFPDPCKDCPSVRNIKMSGPYGLYTKLIHSYLRGTSIRYGGILKNGNDFGNCMVEITGDYSKCYSHYINWRIFGTIKIRKPTITLNPASIFIESFGKDSCTVTVKPECRYIIYVSNPDSTLEVTPYRFPITIYRSDIKFIIKDLKGYKRKSSVTFTINSDCDGSAVTKTLDVIVL